MMENVWKMRTTSNGTTWFNGGVYNINVTPKRVKIVALDPDNLGTLLKKAIVVKRDNTTWLFKIEALEDDKIVIYNRTSGKPMIFVKQTTMTPMTPETFPSELGTFENWEKQQNFPDSPVTQALNEDLRFYFPRKSTVLNKKPMPTTIRKYAEMLAGTLNQIYQTDTMLWQAGWCYQTEEYSVVEVKYGLPQAKPFSFRFKKLDLLPSEITDCVVNSETFAYTHIADYDRAWIVKPSKTRLFLQTIAVQDAGQIIYDMFESGF